MILLIDNYDSFTYNLYQLIEEMGLPCKVIRNDELTLEEIILLKPEHIVLSPGPGRPEEAGVMLEVIKHFGASTPILGVCLGHQAITLAFGGKVVLAPTAFHGKTSVIFHDNRGVFKEVKTQLTVARYHSLMVNDLPDCLEISSQTEDGVIMGIRHKTYPIEGVQFHPESYATEEGKTMLANFFGKAG